jgi:hypothetical protein
MASPLVVISQRPLSLLRCKDIVSSLLSSAREISRAKACSYRKMVRFCRSLDPIHLVI